MWLVVVESELMWRSGTPPILDEHTDLHEAAVEVMVTGRGLRGRWCKREMWMDGAASDQDLVGLSVMEQQGHTAAQA